MRAEGASWGDEVRVVVVPLLLSLLLLPSLLLSLLLRLSLLPFLWLLIVVVIIAAIAIGIHRSRRRLLCRYLSLWSSRSVAARRGRNGRKRTTTNSWSVFVTHQMGLPFHGSPLLVLPPQFLYPARRSRPHPSGKGRGGCSCGYC